jgi:hypothetical protein
MIAKEENEIGIRNSEFGIPTHPSQKKRRRGEKWPRRS